jgi:hypothetical protein
MFDMLQYEVIITEILPGQKAEEALQENIPFFTNGNQFSNFLNYPPSSQAFEKDKWYAWQVVAKDNRSYAAKSETWVFKITEKKNPSTFNSESYIEVKESRNNRDGIYVVKGDDLKFRYYSFDKDKETNIKILSAEGKTLYEQKEIIRSGNNYISLKLNNSFQKEKVYKVTFADQQGNIYNASFSLQ